LGDSVLPDNLQSLEKQAETLFVYHSEDDAVVPFSEFQKYKQKLPTAHAVAFKNKGHFNQETFPEIIEAIKGLYKN
jgi:predicted alpha/beta hydrolase family esterase